MSNTRLAAIAIATCALLSAGLCTGPATAALASPAATITVPCDAASLTSAVNSATAGTVLVLPRGCTYDLIAGLTVSTRLEIIGNGDTIEPGILGSDFSLISVTSTGHLSILDLNLDNASSSDVGGAISNDGGQVTVTGCTFAHDVAGGGGAINSSAGQLRVIDSTFSDNEADAGVHAAGGAIETVGSDAVIKDSSFFDNVSGGSNPKVGGGAIFASVGSLTVIDSTFRGNKAPSGGAIFRSAGPVTIDSSTFTSNSARPGYGGALFVNTTDGLVDGSTFKLNDARADGGAIEVTGDPTIRDTVIDSNTTRGAGGGIYAPGVTLHLIGTTVLRNSASLGGGGIYFTGSLSLAATLFAGNKPDNCVPTIAGC
jgi:predicted outer membrane repeat protein